MKKIETVEQLVEKLPRGLWRDDEGQIYLDRCPECGRENYALSVASGICAWCAFDANQIFKIKTPRFRGIKQLVNVIAE